MNFIPHPVKSAYRNRRLDTTGSLVATYRYSQSKPERVSGRPVELFHRPRVLWTIVQILLVGALAVWTVRNYVDIIRTL